MRQLPGREVVSRTPSWSAWTRCFQDELGIRVSKRMASNVLAMCDWMSSEWITSLQPKSDGQVEKVTRQSIQP